MYKLFQIRLTEAEVNQVNKTGHDSVPKAFQLLLLKHLTKVINVMLQTLLLLI